MRYKLTINLVSRYNETDPAHITYLIEKLAEWSKLKQNEINERRDTLGHSFVATSTKVEKMS